MSRFSSMLWFQVKLYAKNQYFLWLMISSTISMFLTLYLVNYANNSIDDHLWIKAGIFGLWSSATTAAGAISFQKYQQTLPYVLNQTLDDRVALTIIVLPAIFFGFLALPMSYILAILFKLKIFFDSYQVLLGGCLLFIGASVMSLSIATFFVLSSNAIVYEELINIPIVLLAGVFGFPRELAWLGKISRWFIPITGPIDVLLNGIVKLDISAFVFSTFAWLMITVFVFSKILKLSKKTGRLGEL